MSTRRQARERQDGPDRDARRAAPSPAPVTGVLALQQSAGNAAVSAMLARREQDAAGGLWEGARTVASVAATTLGLQGLAIEKPVGRGGENQPLDVAQIRTRLLAVGYAPGEGPEGLASAIERYQTDIVGLRRADGRVDPGGRTIGALSAMKGATAAAPGPAAPATGAAPPAGTPAPPAPAPVVTAPAAPAGPRGALADPELDQLVKAAAKPEVDAAAAELAALEKKFRGLARNAQNEEKGKDRDELVAGFQTLRTRIAGFDAAGLDPRTLASLKGGFHRAMNAISPFYYQGNNIILEFDRINKKTGKLEHVWNTCNITSLAMCLEALGKGPADYKYAHLLPPIAEVYVKDVDERAKDKVGTGFSGLRLPDYLAMAAIVWQMDYKTGTKDEILAGGNKAFNAVPSYKSIKKLAEDFGCKATWETFKLDPAKKKDTGMADLKAHGAKHSKKADVRAEAETKLGDLEKRLAGESDPKRRASLEKEKARLESRIAGTGGLSDAAIEAKLPIEDYKARVLAELRPELDAGRQVVVGQHHHFVRLQSVDDEFVVKDDPGGFTRGNMRATWEEARALGLFWQWISIG